jgi:transcription elongation GreA/GreB family factor
MSDDRIGFSSGVAKFPVLLSPRRNDAMTSRARSNWRVLRNGLVQEIGIGVLNVSVAFTKEDSAETASETLLPDRVISPHPNHVTEAGLRALELRLSDARGAYETAQKIEDPNERRRQAALPLRDARYFAARLRTAQMVPEPSSTDTVAFGSAVTFRRADGRVQKYRIVGEDEADPGAGTISFVSPVARALMGKAVGDVIEASGQEIEIVAISRD